MDEFMFWRVTHWQYAEEISVPERKSDIAEGALV